MKRYVRKGFARLKNSLLGGLEKSVAETRFLMGHNAALQVRSMHTISDLGQVEFQVWSQNGEDGIIDWLIERLDLPVRAFVEFGVEDYGQANTRFLLANRNWRGLIIDGSAANVARIKSDEIYFKHDLTAVDAFIDRENINDIIGSKFSGDVGLLSVDIDGNDYWVLESLRVIRPILLVCEYNAVFGDLYPITVPYDPAFRRGHAHHSNLYFGMSLPALRLLAERMGYAFLGTNSTGLNAFFVRLDYAPRLDGAIGKVSSRPSLFREARDRDGKLTFTAGLLRAQQIAHMPVVDVSSGKTVTLGGLDPLYSSGWLDIILAGDDRRAVEPAPDLTR